MVDSKKKELFFISLVYKKNGCNQGYVYTHNPRILPFTNSNYSYLFVCCLFSFFFGLSTHAVLILFCHYTIDKNDTC